MELIPAIDIIDGKCVRLSKGDFNKKIVYENDPFRVARAFESSGIKKLHIVDLDGAAGKSLKNIDVLTRIAKSTSLLIDFGGGLKTTEDIKAVLNAGASMVSVGSIIVKDYDLFSKWIMDFGTEKFLPGADVLDKKIRVHGWKEDSGIDIFNFIKSLLHLNVQTIFCTDIAKDGMMQGPSIDLYKEIIEEFPMLNLIASGGVSCYEDLLKLQDAGCTGAIIGKAFYEGKITMQQIELFLKQ
ncbi:MAG: 1-(5-phosphoribosyl)-5-[(5-phosphoribosylamino)methylideneamino]imidazole-4-carboxamide isomerase [Ginsengibacter sp.]